MTETQQLLAAYVEEGSETAFRELVSRYVNLVYTTALRLAGGDAHLAQDVVQTVFLQLAQNARKLSRESSLGGWLHRTTCNVASKAMRTERRRLERETQALLMNAQTQPTEARMETIAPILDEAINQLGEEDRKAILLRFYEVSDFRTVGMALGSNEDAARMRVNRALEKLQGILKRKGVAYSTAALGTLLTTGAVNAAPSGLALTVSGVALANAAGGVGATVGVIQFMTTTKLGIAGAIVIAGLAGGLALKQRQETELRAQYERQQRQIEEQQLEIESLKQRPMSTVSERSLSDDERTELLRLRGQIGVLRREVVDLEKMNKQKVVPSPQPVETAQVNQREEIDKATRARNINTAKRWVLAFHMHAASNQGVYPASFEEAAKTVEEVPDAEATQGFELFPLGNIKVSQLENPGKTIVMRGGLFQTVTGDWTRTYGMADGSVQQLTALTPDFHEQELLNYFIYPENLKIRQ